MLPKDPTLMMAWTIGWPEILVILVLALIIFGKRLPDAAKNLAKGLKEFKKTMKETEEDVKSSLDDKK